MPTRSSPETAERMCALLKPRGVLISSNLDFGGESAEYRNRLADPTQG